MNDSLIQTLLVSLLDESVFFNELFSERFNDKNTFLNSHLSPPTGVTM